MDKLTPDELAHAVLNLIAANGSCLRNLEFTTRDGGHHYNTIRVSCSETGLDESVFRPD